MRRHLTARRVSGQCRRWPMAAAAHGAAVDAGRNDGDAHRAGDADLHRRRDRAAGDGGTGLSRCVRRRTRQSAPAGADVSSPARNDRERPIPAPAVERKRALAKEARWRRHRCVPPAAPAASPPLSAPSARDPAAASAQGDDKVMAAADGARAKEEVAGSPADAAAGTVAAARASREQRVDARRSCAAAPSTAKANDQRCRPAEAGVTAPTARGVAQAPMRQAPSPTGRWRRGHMRGEVDDRRDGNCAPKIGWRKSSSCARPAGTKRPMRNSSASANAIRRSRCRRRHCRRPAHAELRTVRRVTAIPSHVVLSTRSRRSTRCTPGSAWSPDRMAAYRQRAMRVRSQRGSTSSTMPGSARTRPESRRLPCSTHVALQR